MSILSRADRTRRVALDAVMIALAMMLSYLEVLLPLGAVIPIPGFRLGLANLVVLAVFYLLSPIDAAAVSATRILLMGLLFGSATSLFFSAMGGLFSFLVLLLATKMGKKCSFIGVSILSAAAHNCGQITAAVVLFDASLILTYLPWLLIAATVYGGTVGVLLNLLMPRLSGIFERRRTV